MARFLPDSGLLIQHVPRAGGSFVECALDELGVPFVRWLEKQPSRYPKKHSLLSHYHREPMVQVRSVACFVREPVAYYRSVWCWLTGAGERKRERLQRKWSWHPHASAARLYSPHFGEWADRLLELEPGWATRIFEAYAGPEGGEFCGFIGRTETVADDLWLLLYRSGSLPEGAEREDLLRLPRRNESRVPRPSIGVWAEEQIRESERVAVRRWYGDETIDRRWYGEWSEG